MASDDRVFLIGEDIIDPYGGAFKVTSGISTLFEARVLAMPISEGGMVGLATGMAIRGLKPIVEIMFGDFTTLTFDQLINHASKFEWMYNSKVNVPLIIRTPMGGGRGYGPTHSQSIEKHFCGVPGLTVRCINQYSDIEHLYKEAYESNSPQLIIENKTMYALSCMDKTSIPDPSDPDVVILTYGSGVQVTVQAAKKLLEEEEVRVKVVPIEILSPLNHDDIRKNVSSTNVVIVEEGSPGWGFASECSLALAGQPLTLTLVSGPDHPIPNNRDWELSALPSVDGVVKAVLQNLGLDSI